MDTIELADGGILHYHDALRPRLPASYGDEGATYFYSGPESARRSCCGF